MGVSQPRRALERSLAANARSGSDTPLLSTPVIGLAAVIASASRHCRSLPLPPDDICCCHSVSSPRPGLSPERAWPCTSAITSTTSVRIPAAITRSPHIDIVTYRRFFTVLWVPSVSPTLIPRPDPKRAGLHQYAHLPFITAIGHPAAGAAVAIAALAGPGRRVITEARQHTSLHHPPCSARLAYLSLLPAAPHWLTASQHRAPRARRPITRRAPRRSPTERPT